MLPILHRMLLCLALLAVAHMQAVGVPTGYFCGCTGEPTRVADCDESACHPHHAHADGCDDESQAGADGAAAHEEPLPGHPVGSGHHHKHRSTGENPVALAHPGAPTVPPAVFFVLASAIPIPEAVEMPVWASVGSRFPRPPDDTGPTASVRIVRSVVRLL